MSGLTRRRALAAMGAAPLAAGASRAWGAASPPGGPSGPPLPLDRLGASTGSMPGRTLVEAVREIRGLGFQTLEVIGFEGARHSMGAIPGFAHHRLGEAERREVFALTRGFRHVTMHLPFQDLQPFSLNPDVREMVIDLFKKSIDGLAFLKGELAVIHTGGPPAGLTYKEIWPRMVETFRTLGDHAQARGIKLGIETMQPASVADYTRLVLEVGHPAVGATVDTGHIRGCSDIGLPPDKRDSDEGRRRFNDALGRIIEILGDKVVHFHLHDVKGADWRDHQAPPGGAVDFPRLLSTLRKRKFRGLLVFELEEPEAAAALKASKAYVEKLMR